MPSILVSLLNSFQYQMAHCLKALFTIFMTASLYSVGTNESELNSVYLVTLRLEIIFELFFREEI